MRSHVVMLLALTGCQSGFLGFGDGPPLARGLLLEKIAVYQAVEVPVMDDFEAAEGLASVIAGREALVRVFVEQGDLFEPRDIKAHLILDDGEDTTELEVEAFIDSDSVDSDLDSTLNFTVPAELITPTTSFAVELREAKGGVKAEGDDFRAAWPVEGLQPLRAAASAPLEVRLVPIRYNGDGSGRLPDTSEAQVARYQEMFDALYPATAVTVTVDDPMSWSRPVTPEGGGWGELLYAMMMYRDDADVAPNTYFYGIFNGASTLGRYCERGCILGLSTLPAADEVYGRASIGLGFSGPTSIETAVHEVGHAHGREHAPCGLYGQPSDRDYPYRDAELGVWGYDSSSGELLDPEDNVDMMSYCSPLWMSDYTYEGIRERIAEVETQNRAAPLPPGQRSFHTALVDADGHVTLRDTREFTHRPMGTSREIEVVGAAGRTTVDAAYYPFDHLDGGVLVFPDEGDVRSVRLR